MPRLFEFIKENICTVFEIEGKYNKYLQINNQSSARPHAIGLKNYNKKNGDLYAAVHE